MMRRSMGIRGAMQKDLAVLLRTMQVNGHQGGHAKRLGRSIAHNVFSPTLAPSLPDLKECFRAYRRRRTIADGKPDKPKSF